MSQVENKTYRGMLFVAEAILLLGLVFIFLGSNIMENIFGVGICIIAAVLFSARLILMKMDEKKP